MTPKAGCYRYTASGQIGERIDALGQRLGYEWDAQ